MNDIINTIAGVFVLLIHGSAAYVAVTLLVLFLYREILPIFTGHFPWGARRGTWQERRMYKMLGKPLNDWHRRFDRRIDHD